MKLNLRWCEWRGGGLMALGIAVMCGCGGGNESGRGGRIQLFFTGDTHGRLEQCGCFDGQVGGLTRVRTVQEQLQSGPALKVDIGNALTGTEDFHLIHYRYILRAYESMGYDGLNIGLAEARLSRDQLAQVRNGETAPLVSANLFDSTDGELIFPSHRWVERAGLRIACIGVIDPMIVGNNLGEGLEIRPMREVLLELLPGLADRADLIVLLAYTDREGLEELAREFYECDIILGGHVTQPSSEWEQKNQSLVAYITNQAKALGTSPITVEARGGVTAETLGMILLTDDYPEHSAIRALAQEYRNEIRHTPLKIDEPGAVLTENAVPGVQATASYVGSDSCASCHRSAYTAWEESGHAHAFDSLKNRDSDADPNCIACHTVGFGSKSGYQREFGERKLIHVGCESCHGPGSEHVSQHQSGDPITFRFRPLGPADCQRCHYGEFSRPFDWEQFWPKVKHGKEPTDESVQIHDPRFSQEEMVTWVLNRIGGETGK